jgi:hypothetical protein
VEQEVAVAHGEDQSEARRALETTPVALFVARLVWQGFVKQVM